MMRAICSATRSSPTAGRSPSRRTRRFSRRRSCAPTRRRLRAAIRPTASSTSSSASRCCRRRSTSTNFYVRDAANLPVAGTLSLRNGDRTIRFTPAAPFAANNYNYVYPTNGLRDLQNTPFAGTNFYFYAGTSERYRAADPRQHRADQRCDEHRRQRDRSPLHQRDHQSADARPAAHCRSPRAPVRSRRA